MSWNRFIRTQKKNVHMYWDPGYHSIKSHYHFLNKSQNISFRSWQHRVNRKKQLRDWRVRQWTQRELER